MGAFDDAKFEWRGKEYSVPANRILPMLARVDEFITLAELSDHLARKSVPFAKVALAWGAVLRYAGAHVTDEDVYCGMLEGDGGASATLALHGLMGLMMPKSQAKDTHQGNEWTPPEAAGKRSSKKHTKPQ